MHPERADNAAVFRRHAEGSSWVTRDGFERFDDGREVRGYGRCGQLVLGVQDEDRGEVALLRPADDDAHAVRAHVGPAEGCPTQLEAVMGSSIDAAAQGYPRCSFTERALGLGAPAVRDETG
jgi:hypothetical protein